MPIMDRAKIMLYVQFSKCLCGKMSPERLVFPSDGEMG